MMKRMIAFLCAIVMLLLCFASCDEMLIEDPDESSKKTTEETGDTPGNEESYTVVYGKDCGSKVAKRANVLAEKLRTVYGVTVNAGTDDRYIIETEPRSNAFDGIRVISGRETSVIADSVDCIVVVPGYDIKRIKNMVGENVAEKLLSMDKLFEVQ